MRCLSGLALVAAAVLAACGPAPPVEIAMTNGQGEIAGEVTSTSVILQTRLTSKEGWVDGDLPGVDGVARFEIATGPDFAEPMTTEWLTASAESDHIVKARVGGLTPGTEYHYRAVYGPDPEHTETGATRSFATHPGADAAAETSFTVVTGMNYYQFHDNPRRAYTGPDKELGYPGLASMLALEPDFFVATGDNVYYDTPYEGRADDRPDDAPKVARAAWTGAVHRLLLPHLDVLGEGRPRLPLQRLRQHERRGAAPRPRPADVPGAGAGGRSGRPRTPSPTARTA